LKILLTNFPALPDECVRDESYEYCTPYPLSEVKEFQTYLNKVKDLIDLDAMNQGTIFFIKLGEGKHALLEEDRESFKDGLSTSMHFLKSLNLIRLNEFEINKDTAAENMDTFIISKNSEDYKNIGLTEERDRLSDILFQIRYASDANSAKEIKSHPNIYKYFPAVKEVNNLAFHIHSNVFELSSNRQNLQKTSINAKLLGLLAKRISERMNQWQESSINKYNKIFESILFSDFSGKTSETDGTGWQKKYFYDPLYDYTKNNVPTKEGGFLSSDKVVIKKTQLDVNPSELGVEKQWFYRDSKDPEELIDIASKKLSIKRWNIGNLIEHGDTAKINSWIANLSSEHYKVFLEELNASLPKSGIADIRYIRSKTNRHYSLSEIKESNSVVIVFEKISHIVGILESLNLSC